MITLDSLNVARKILGRVDNDLNCLSKLHKFLRQDMHNVEVVHNVPFEPFSHSYQGTYLLLNLFVALVHLFMAIVMQRWEGIDSGSPSLLEAYQLS